MPLMAAGCVLIASEGGRVPLTASDGLPHQVRRIESGELDAFFSVIGPKQPNGEHIPAATIHSDMGYVLIASDDL